jgi:hypothetical protein
MSENNGDPVGDFQRWLMKQGAKGMARQVADRVRSTVGAGPDPKADVWETATTEPPLEEPPECKWCPICRAARAAQRTPQSGGSVSVNDTLSGLVQDAFSVIDGVLRSNNGPVAGSRVAGRTVVHPQDKNGESADESGDRAEGRDSGDGPAESGGDEQVGWPAE